MPTVVTSRLSPDRSGRGITEQLNRHEVSQGEDSPSSPELEDIGDVSVGGSPSEPPPMEPAVPHA